MWPVQIPPESVSHSIILWRVSFHWKVILVVIIINNKYNECYPIYFRKHYNVIVLYMAIDCINMACIYTRIDVFLQKKPHLIF